MAADPGCSGDLAVFATDGNLWWMSPDVELNWPGSAVSGSIAGPGVADPAVVNKVRVRVRLREPWDDSATGANVELYVCKPSPVMSPLVNSFQIRRADGNPGFMPRSGTAALSGPPPDSEWENYTSWRPTQNPGVANGPGHKCLIARTCQSTFQFDPDNFYSVVDDDHYVQRNICIAPCPNPGSRLRA